MNTPSIIKRILLCFLALICFCFGVYLLLSVLKMMIIVLKNYETNKNIFLILAYFLRCLLNFILVFYLIFPYCYYLLEEAFKN